QSKTTRFRIVVDWDHRRDSALARYGWRLCIAVGSRAKGPSSQDASSIAESRRTNQTICRHLLPGRRGFFRTAGVCGKVSRYECSFHRYWSTQWSNLGVVRSPAQNVQKDSHQWSARSDCDDWRYRAL